MQACTTHKKLLSWVDEITKLTKPQKVIWYVFIYYRIYIKYIYIYWNFNRCDGSKEEADSLFDHMVRTKSAIKLNEKLRPNSYLFRSNPNVSIYIWIYT